MSANDDPGSCWSDDVDCLSAMSADDVSGFLGEISPLSSRPGDRTAQMDENETATRSRSWYSGCIADALPKHLTDDSSRVVPLTTTVNLEPDDPRRLAALCGPLDQNVKLLEQRLGVRITYRGHTFRIAGPAQRVHAAGAVLSGLYVETREQETLGIDTVHLFLQESGVAELLARKGGDADGGQAPGADGPTVIKTRKKTVKARGANQKGYVAAIRAHDLNFGVGPAGTGKTYLAVACAVEALEANAVNRILLVRPAVEAGEKLGFLPGDLAQKIDPYLRPLYDALYEMLGVDRVGKYIERGVIEVAPLAFMRGRTLNGSFIILDESQNTTVEQMKMFLTRIGFGSTAVVTGDITQIDLPGGQRSGLVHVLRVLEGVEGISFTHFNSKDVVRHPLVQRIVDAYARIEQNADKVAATAAVAAPAAWRGVANEPPPG